MNHKKSKPPWLGQWILKNIVPKDERRYLIEGIEEKYLEEKDKKGSGFAYLWYLKDILLTVPFILMDNFMRTTFMFKNYFKIALRHIGRHKGYSMINISGLAMGMACTIFIFLWVQDELSFDRFHGNKDNIYRVDTIFRTEGDTFYGSQTPATVAPFLKDNFPEILKATTVSSSWTTGNTRNIIKYKEDAFYTDDLILTDPSFFEIFSFPFLKGDFKSALSNPNDVVLTQSVAEKCFGSEDPMNKSLQVDGNIKTVTGVIKDIPDNSHLQFDVILPLNYIRSTDRAFFLDKWDSYGFATYVLLQEGIGKNTIDEKIDGVIIKNDPRFSDTAAHIFLEPVLNIRLYNPDGSRGLMQYVYIFSTIAVIVLLIACINYMNLATARAVNRAKEIGLRKVIGSRRSQIIRQFFSESLIYSFVSFLISIFIVTLFLPQFNALTGKRVALSVSNPGHIFGLALIALCTGLISGCYPALVLSSFNPIDIMKKSLKTGPTNSLFRKILVVIQFSLSISLIVCMMIVSNQVGYMRNAEVGFEKENVICLPVSGSIENVFPSFKNELKNNPDILHVSLKSSSPLRSGPTSGTISWEGKDPELQINWHHPMVDHDYLKTLNMQIIEGRDFSEEIQSDLRQGFILNEEAKRQGNIKNPVGKRITVNGSTGMIIGVVKNAQLNSLRFNVQPEVYHLSRTFQEKFQTIFIKYDSGEDNRRFENSTVSLAYIESVWKKFMPDAPFEYSFLDASLENQYRAEMRIRGILNAFTFLAVFLSCLGLFGLTSFTVEQRTKEIAVRKTLGAPVSKVVFILMNRFLRWILISNIIAWPVAYYVMNNWLQDFANRINIGIVTFLFAGLLTLIIAVFTVISQSLKAALANPVDALKYE